MSRPEFVGIFSDNAAVFSRNYEIMREHPQARSISSIINLAHTAGLTGKPEIIFENFGLLAEVVSTIAEKTSSSLPFTASDLGSAAILTSGTAFNNSLEIRQIRSIYQEALRGGWYTNVRDRYKVASDFSSFALTHNLEIEDMFDRFLDLKTTDFLKEDGVVTDASLTTLTTFSYWLGIGETINKEGQVVTKRFLTMPNSKSWQDPESQTLMTVASYFSNNPGADLDDYRKLFLTESNNNGLNSSRDLAKALYIVFKRMTGANDKEALGLYKQLIRLKGIRENIDILQIMISIGALHKNINLTTQRYSNGGVSLVFLSNPKT